MTDERCKRITEIKERLAYVRSLLEDMVEAEDKAAVEALGPNDTTSALDYLNEALAPFDTIEDRLSDASAAFDRRTRIAAGLAELQSQESSSRPLSRLEKAMKQAAENLNKQVGR